MNLKEANMDANFPRLFTVNEANGLLPLLRPLVEQILENIRRLKGVSETVIRREQLDPDAPNLMEKLREDPEVLRLVTQIKDWVTAINGHGCVCKGVEQGLIDFPCMLGAEVVKVENPKGGNSTSSVPSVTARAGSGRRARPVTCRKFS